MTDDTTSVTIAREHLEAIDDAAEAIFGTDGVRRRDVVDRLLVDHDAVPYDG